MGNTLTDAFKNPNDKEIMKDIFNNYDVNKDGQISKEEFKKLGRHFVQFLEDKHKKETGEQLEKDYEKYIKDIPKSFSILDFSNTDTNKLINLLFDEVDLNKNGSISFDEFESWIKEKQKKEVSRYDSFAPVREGINATFYHDAKEAYVDMYEGMLSAKKEIFISDWFISPEVLLKREMDKYLVTELNMEYRLDKILAKKSKEGVKIYILIWNETDIALKLGSYRAEQEFLKIDNVSVIRHPTIDPLDYSHHQKLLIIDQNVAFLGGLDLCFGRYDDGEHRLFDDESIIWPGKDYYNPDIASIGGLDYPSKDFFDRKTNPRMPWHDVHCRVDGMAARDISRNFIERFNHHNSQRLLLSQYPILRLRVDEPDTTKGTSTVQILRSLSKWSGGVEKTEISIQNAMIDLIKNSEHFIYIENQYFITSCVEEDKGPVKNKIGLAIVNRLRIAIKENQSFRVVVILPVHPEGFWADFSTKFILGHEMSCISADENSILGILKKEFPEVDLMKYIFFFTIRKCVIKDDMIYNNQIYVHSKLTIVDDRHVIIGSANINDRSLIGDRDSEIAAVISDNDQIEIEVDGKPFKASKFAHNLRVNLYKEHLRESIDLSIISDPIKCFDVMIVSAESNLEIFKKIFPLSEDKNLAKLRVLARSTKLNDDNKILFQGIYGHLVSFRLNRLTIGQIKDFYDLTVWLLGEKTFL